MTARKRGLGRGLDALLGGSEGAEGAAGPAESGVARGAFEVAVTDLVPNREQPRTDFDREELEALAASIRSQGLIQPIVVAEEPGGGFMILAGERRWRAAQRAGLQRVPVIVRSVESEQHRLELALVENLQRSDLNALEEAEAYQALRQRFGLSQEEIAERVGKGRTTITNALRLLRLPDEVRDLVRRAELTAGQARPLLGAGSPERQIELAERAVKEGLSARELEAMASRSEGAPKKKKTRAKPTDVHDRAAEERLTQALQTKVEIRRRGSGGQMRVHFHSEGELMRLYELLLERS